MKESSRKKMGRKPKADPAIHRYGIKLTNEENVRFEAAFSESGMKEKAYGTRFLRALEKEVPQWESVLAHLLSYASL